MRATLEQRSAGDLALNLSGDVVLDDAAELYAQLRRLAAERGTHRLTIDFSHVDRLDSAGAVAASMGLRLAERADKMFELTGLSKQHEAAFALVTESRESAPHVLRRRRILPQRAAVAAWVLSLAELSELVVDTVLSGLRSILRRDRRRFADVAEQTVLLGVDAWFIVALLSFLIGVIMAFQGAFQLRKFGADVYMAELVSLGMVREFGAFITAIVLSGRSGAAIAAELGTMVVHEEVDAIKSMGLSPAQYLVFPRVAGIALAQPLLTLMSMAVGIGAGIATGTLVGIAPSISYRRMQDALVVEDFALGLIKSVLFSWIIGFVGSYMGLATRGGARSVGRNTTMAVVLSIFLIVVTDSIVTTAWTVSHDSSFS